VIKSEIPINSLSPVLLYHHLLIYYLNLEAKPNTYLFASKKKKEKKNSLSFLSLSKQWRPIIRIKYKNSFSGPNSLISISQTTSLYTLIASKSFPNSKTTLA
jgi:hypothetical protein